MEQKEVDRKTEAKWLSDKITLDKHKSKIVKDLKGLFKNIEEQSCALMRIDIENADRWVKEQNEIILAEQEKNKCFPDGKPGKDFEMDIFYIIETDDNGKVTSKKVNIDKVAEFLMHKFKFKTIYGSKFEEIYVYHDGVYTKEGKAIIQTVTENLLSSFCKTNAIREITEKIKRQSQTFREDFENIPNDLICVENGVIDLKNNKLLEFNPIHNFKTRLPIKYDPNAECPEIKAFLKETLYEEDLELVQEWFGFQLYPQYFIKKASIFYGEKDTGKTVLLNLLSAFMGRKNISGISLQRIAKGDKFALASLNNKYSNIFDDLSSQDVNDTGGFKIATGGGFITAEFKFGDCFQFLNYAKHTFATNKIPEIDDYDDEAYYSRWIPIAFDNQVSEIEKDPFLINKITDKEELSGLLNYALEGLSRLLKNKRFSFDKTPKEIKVIMRNHGNSLSSFVNNILFPQDGNKISKEEMYDIYTHYIMDKGLKKLTHAQLSRNLERYCNFIQARHGKKRYWVGAGIRKLEYNSLVRTTL